MKCRISQVKVSFLKIISSKNVVANNVARFLTAKKNLLSWTKNGVRWIIGLVIYYVYSRYNQTGKNFI